MCIWITMLLQLSQIKPHVGNAGQRNPLRLMRVQPLLSPCRPRQLHSLSCCCLHSNLPPSLQHCKAGQIHHTRPGLSCCFSCDCGPAIHWGTTWCLTVEVQPGDQIQTSQATGTNLPTSIYLCNPERRNSTDWRKQISKHVATGFNTIKKSETTRGL